MRMLWDIATLHAHEKFFVSPLFVRIDQINLLHCSRDKMLRVFGFFPSFYKKRKEKLDMGHECFFTCACNGAMSHKLHANLLLKTWYVRSVKNIKSINSIDDVQGSDK